MRSRQSGAQGEQTDQDTEMEEPVDAQDAAETTEHGADDGAAAYITALQAELEDVRVKLEDTEKRLGYAQAEFQNVARRREEQYRADMKFANGELIKALLPVIDNFERALKAAEQTRSYDALIGGISGTHRQLQTALEKAGVTPIEAIGKEFDPQFHEAIGHTEDSDLPPNTVAEEVQRGYLMHDRVLRPTLVKVAE